MLPFYEPFPNTYAEGERLGSGASATIWDSGNSAGTGSPTNTSAARLTYPGLEASNDSRGILLDGTPSSNRDRGVAFSPVVTMGAAVPSLYVSFLLNVRSAPSVARRVAYFRNSTSSGNPTAGIFLNASSQLQVVKSATTPTAASTLPLNTGTHLVVMRYRWVSAATGDDEVALWLDPGSLDASESGVPDPILATTNGADVATLDAFFISHRTDANGTLWLDEVRVATNWAGVTPSDGTVMEGRPRITEAFVSTSELVLRGTNGTPSGVYQVLSATNLALTADDWSVIATNAFDSAGNFDCTNAVSASTTGNYFRLRLSGTLPPEPVAPAIIAEPADTSVIVSQNASFSVTATGTSPLAYQWHSATAAIPEATGSSLTTTNAQASDAGGYRVIITNSAGSATSRLAMLTVISTPTVGTPEGYATLDGNTTVGTGGETVTANNLADFTAYVGDDIPRVVLVQGTINLGSSNVRVRDKKTILGVGTNATLVGDLKVYGNNNVIIQNLIFTNPSGVGDGDGLSLQDCRNIWVDHCTFVDCDDGSLDISPAADWITVSWCHFYYTNPANDHRFSNLVGHSDNNAAEDAGKLHVTFHHNWWGQLVHERMPRVRFGRVHCHNNFYDAVGNNNCIRAARDSEILVENNYFNAVKNVWELYRTEGIDGKVLARGNIEVNTTWSAGSDSNSIQILGTDVLSAEPNGLNPPPYAYTLDTASSVPATITAGAGAGKGPFAP